jgi:hypothetical protein
MSAVISNQRPLPRTIPLSALPPELVTRGVVEAEPDPARRTKIWEFNTNLHCSIIGTCLSTSELRQVLRKLDRAPPNASDHDLHGIAVTMAGRHDLAAKLLNKALDQRHRLAVSQFAKVDTEDKVRALWRDSVRRSEIPGAYWAVLTHPATTRAVISEAFGEVHMLSHLVGAANRADIRRLCQLEADNSELQAKLDRQQRALHEAIIMRDARIRELSDALTQRILSEDAANQTAGAEDAAMLRRLVADLERRLGSETRRRTALDERLAAARAATTSEHSARVTAERECEALRAELNAVESSLTIPQDNPEPPARLDNIVVFYVGGRPHQVAHLRTVAEGRGAVFLHHDGGVENHPNLLAGLISRADFVVFPVDCISHEAVLMVKSLCHQTGKRYIPLRSASVTALLAALQRQDGVGLPEAAD